MTRLVKEISTVADRDAALVSARRLRDAFFVEVLASLLSLVLLAGAAIRQPDRATCPGGWRVDGLDRAGLYTCERPFGCVDERGPRGGWTSRCAGAWRLTSRVYCTGGQRPVVTAGEGVACEAVH